MKRFFDAEAIFHIPNEEIEALKSRAKTEDKDAQFCLGRYYNVVQPDEDASYKARDLFKSAMANGSLEAEVALSLMYSKGEALLPVDVEKSDEMLQHAVSQGCEWAKVRYVRRLIYGDLFAEKDHDLALDIIEETLKGDCDKGEWFCLKGELLELSESLSASREWYLKARAEGCVKAHAYAAVALCYDDEYNMVDWENFLDLTDKGFEEHNNTLCLSLQKLVIKEHLDDVPAYKWHDVREEIRQGLELANRLGDLGAIAALGDIYRCGEMDIMQRYSMAWAYYARLAILGGYEGYEKLYSMMKSRQVEKSDELKYSCAINAVRYGCKEMIPEVIKLYKRGELDAYAKEIEKYYMPIYLNMPDDDYPDDDGRFDGYA